MTSDDKKEKAEEMVERIGSKFEVPLIKTADIVDELNSCESEKPILVDVRSDAEIKVSIIPGALTKAEFEKLCNETDMKSYHIVPYCTIGMRSGIYASQLLKSGYKNVSNGEGILLWTHYHPPPHQIQDNPKDNASCRNVTTSSTLKTIELVDMNLITKDKNTNEWKKTDRVHVYSENFDLASSRYQSVKFTTWEQFQSSLSVAWDYFFNSIPT